MATESRVQIEKLDSNNYGIWSRRLKALLLSKELMDVVTGDEDDKKKSNQALGIIQLYLMTTTYQWRMASPQQRAFGTS